MTDSPTSRGISDRTLTVRAASGEGVITLPAVPAGLALGAALAVAPRLTAAAALGALFARMSLSIED
jgi:hypothetical protein